MAKFYEVCLNVEKPTFNPECSATVMKMVGLPLDRINKCYFDSFISTDKSKDNYEIWSENTLLNEDNKIREKFVVRFLPVISINGRQFNGSWRPDNIFEALCAGFNKKPQVCYDEGAFKKKSSTLSWFSVILIIILIIAVNGIIFYFCKKYIRRKIAERIESTDINHKINTGVTSYLALRDNK